MVTVITTNPNTKVDSGTVTVVKKGTGEVVSQTTYSSGKKVSSSSGGGGGGTYQPYEDYTSGKISADEYAKQVTSDPNVSTEDKWKVAFALAFKKKFEGLEQQYQKTAEQQKLATDIRKSQQMADAGFMMEAGKTTERPSIEKGYEALKSGLGSFFMEQERKRIEKEGVKQTFGEWITGTPPSKETKLSYQYGFGYGLPQLFGIGETAREIRASQYVTEKSPQLVEWTKPVTIPVGFDRPPSKRTVTTFEVTPISEVARKELARREQLYLEATSYAKPKEVGLSPLAFEYGKMMGRVASEISVTAGVGKGIELSQKALATAEAKQGIGIGVTRFISPETRTTIRPVEFTEEYRQFYGLSKGEVLAETKFKDYTVMTKLEPKGMFRQPFAEKPIVWGKTVTPSAKTYLVKTAGKKPVFEEIGTIYSKTTYQALGVPQKEASELAKQFMIVKQRPKIGLELPQQERMIRITGEGTELARITPRYKITKPEGYEIGGIYKVAGLEKYPPKGRFISKGFGAFKTTFFEEPIKIPVVKRPPAGYKVVLDFPKKELPFEYSFQDIYRKAPVTKELVLEIPKTTAPKTGTLTETLTKPPTRTGTATLQIPVEETLPKMGIGEAHRRALEQRLVSRIKTTKQPMFFAPAQQFGVTTREGLTTREKTLSLRITDTLGLPRVTPKRPFATMPTVGTDIITGVTTKVGTRSVSIQMPKIATITETITEVKAPVLPKIGIPPVKPFEMPPIIIPPIGFGATVPSRIKGFAPRYKRKAGYTPTLYSAFTGYRAKIPKGAGEMTYTGMEVRPMPLGKKGKKERLLFSTRKKTKRRKKK
jgi:hypothetical protein